MANIVHTGGGGREKNHQKKSSGLGSLSHTLTHARISYDSTPSFFRRHIVTLPPSKYLVDAIYPNQSYRSLPNIEQFLCNPNF